MTRPIRTDSDWVAAMKIWDGLSLNKPFDDGTTLLALSTLTGGIYAEIHGCEFGFGIANSWDFWGANFFLAYTWLCVYTRAIRGPIYAIPLMPSLLFPELVMYGLYRLAAYIYGEILGRPGGPSQCHDLPRTPE